MRVKVAQVFWHGREPVMAVDIHPTGRLATCGADSDVKIWRLASKSTTSDGYQWSVDHPEHLADLSAHSKAVNCVRFSPQGDCLASAGDDGGIYLWRWKNEKDGESWSAGMIFRGHISDVYDLSWAPDGKRMVSGSIDNTAIVWDTESGRALQVLNDHNHFVQGVNWDPLGEYIITQSCDRSMKVFRETKKKKDSFTCAHSLKTFLENKTDPTDVKPPFKHRMFLDDSASSFFRRPTWSPDGALLFTSASHYQANANSPLQNNSYIFLRNNLSRPAVSIPMPEGSVIAIRCCSVLYSLVEGKPSFIDLPYRIVFAVATFESILIYDTQSTHPIAFVGGVHCSGLTDLAWTCDGLGLVVSSSDGYCTLASFRQDEFGVPLPLEDYPDNMRAAHTLRESHSLPSLHAKDPSDQPKITKPCHATASSATSTNITDGPPVTITPPQQSNDVPKVNILAVKRKVQPADVIAIAAKKQRESEAGVAQIKPEETVNILTVRKKTKPTTTPVEGDTTPCTVGALDQTAAINASDDAKMSDAPKHGDGGKCEEEPNNDGLSTNPINEEDSTTSPKAKQKLEFGDADEANQQQVGDLVGRKVRKAFPGHGMFDGEVVVFDADESWYTVKYADGDEEQLTAEELKPLIV